MSPLQVAAFALTQSPSPKFGRGTLGEGAKVDMLPWSGAVQRSFTELKPPT